MILMSLQIPTQFKTDDDRHGRPGFLTRGVLQDMLGQSFALLPALPGKRGGDESAVGCEMV